jgi:hypothetical protein
MRQCAGSSSLTPITMNEHLKAAKRAVSCEEWSKQWRIHLDARANAFNISHFINDGRCFMP